MWIKSRTRSIRRGSRVQGSEKRCRGERGSNKAEKKSTPSRIAGKGELPPLLFPSSMVMESQQNY